MTKAAISALFSDLKFIKTRSVCQIILETPIEAGPEIVAAFGTPLPGSEIPVAIARLHDGAADKPSSTEPTSEQSAAPSPRTIDDMPYPQQAALLCKQEPFQAFMNRVEPNWDFPMEQKEEENAAFLVREFCDVKSRSELQPGTVAAAKWVGLYQAYKSEHPF